MAHIESVTQQKGSWSWLWISWHASVWHCSNISLINCCDEGIMKFRWNLKQTFSSLIQNRRSRLRQKRNRNYCRKNRIDQNVSMFELKTPNFETDRYLWSHQSLQVVSHCTIGNGRYPLAGHIDQTADLCTADLIKQDWRGIR